MSPRRVFRSDDHERSAAGPGYFKTRLLDEGQVTELRRVVEGVFASVQVPFEWANGTFQFTGIHSNLAFVDALYERLTEFLRPHLDQVFIDYTQVLAGVFNKPPQTPDSDLRTHQDPSFVEPPYRTFVAWIPLVDISHENGSFFVLPGSQHLFPFRPVIQPPVFGRCDQLLAKVGQRIDTRVGDLVVFDTGLVHWSLANLGPHPRPAVQLVNVPTEAPFFFPYYSEYEETKRIELYGMPMDQVRRHPWYRPERPTGYPLVKSFDFEFKTLSEADLIQLIGPYNDELGAMSKHTSTTSGAAGTQVPSVDAPPQASEATLLRRAQAWLERRGVLPRN